MSTGFNIDIEVELEGFGEVWRSGQTLIAVTVQNGLGEKTSSCSVTIADPSHRIAEALIKHSLDNGGIAPLPGSTVSPGSTGLGGTVAPSYAGKPANAQAWEQAIVAECLKHGVTDKNQIAYILGTAYHESDRFNTQVEYASGVAYEGRSDLGNNRPGDGVRFKGRGLVQVTGRANYEKWSKKLGVDVVGKPQLLEQPGYSLTTLVVGMKEGIYTGRKVSDYIGGSKADFYNARRVVNDVDKAELIAGYARGYVGKVDALKAATGVPATTKTTPAPSTSETVPVEQVIKGNKLIARLGEFQFEYYHQGTIASNDGTVQITGQGIRWVLNRRKRTKAIASTSLKELSETVAKSHGLKLDYQAKLTPTYTFVDQRGLTDFQLLNRETAKAGLFLKEEGNTLSIKELSQIKDTGLLLQPGLNLISYRFQDKPIDQYANDAGASTLQAEAKTDIAPITGELKQTKRELDPVTDLSVTGSKAPVASGTLVPGQEAAVDQNRARTKRVQGLPSTFVLPMSESTLELEPLSAVRTKGIKGVLDRVWMVNSVRHSIPEYTTTLECYTPVEVLDITPATNAPGVSTSPGSPVTLKPGGFIYPCKGHPVTDVRRPRSATRFHHGTDIGCPTGTPIVASADGTVLYAEDQSGYGNVIYVNHTGGYQTRYAHLSQMLVRPGQAVKQGQKIGVSGNTGIGSGPHLHVEWRLNGNSLDPSQVGLSAKVGQVW